MFALDFAKGEGKLTVFKVEHNLVGHHFWTLWTMEISGVCKSSNHSERVLLAEVIRHYRVPKKQNRILLQLGTIFCMTSIIFESMTHVSLGGSSQLVSS